MTQRQPDRSPPHESASPRPPDRLAKVLKWVTAGTAVLSLVFGVRTLSNIISERRAKEQQIVELLGTAQLQREGRDYASAWASLERAATIEGDDERVRRLQEDVAMNWLRDIRGDAGPSPFTRIVDQVTPVLNRGILAATGERKADLQSWLGWSDFLRWRDGRRDLDPARRYREALAGDSLNVFAHAMLAHWLLWNNENADEARRHFERAVAAGRERDFVRQLQLAAYTDRSGSEADGAVLRFANELRVAQEAVPSRLRSRIWAIYYRCLGEDPSRCPAASVDRDVSPSDHLATFRWLYADSLTSPDARVPLRLQLARLEERAGETDSALTHYRAVSSALGAGMDPRVEAQVRSAIRRLAR